RPRSIAFVFFSSRRRHTSFSRDWSSDVYSSDLRRVRREVVPVRLELLTDVVALRLDAFRVLHADAECPADLLVDVRRDRALEVRSDERRVGQERGGRAAG